MRTQTATKATFTASFANINPSNSTLGEYEVGEIQSLKSDLDFLQHDQTLRFDSKADAVWAFLDSCRQAGNDLSIAEGFTAGVHNLGGGAVYKCETADGITFTALWVERA